MSYFPSHQPLLSSMAGLSSPSSYNQPTNVVGSSSPFISSIDQQQPSQQQPPQQQQNSGQAPPPSHRRTISEGESADMETLEKENFDLKLRLFYLEEKTKAGLPLPNQLYSSLMQNAELQSTMESLEQELETKNGLLVKARSVIEALTQDGQQQKQQFADQRAQLQIEMNDRIHQAIHSMEGQVSAARNQAQEASAKRLAVEEELTQLRMVLQQMEAAANETIQENGQLTNDVRLLQLQIAEKDAVLTKQLDMVELLKKEHQKRIESDFVSKEEYNSLAARYTSLEQQMSEWKVEIQARELQYKQTNDSLNQTLTQIEELKVVQTKFEAAQQKLHESDLLVLQLRQENERQQIKFETMLKEDDTRLNELHQTELAQVTEANAKSFHELQDMYQKQIAELKLAEEEHLKHLKLDHDEAVKELERELEQLKEMHQAQLDQLDEKAKQQQDELIQSIDQQWKEKENNFNRQSKAQTEKYQTLELLMAKDFISLNKFQDLQRKYSQEHDEFRALKQRYNEVKSENDRIKLETVPLIKFQEMEDKCERNENEIQTLQAQLQRSSQQLQQQQPWSGVNRSASPTHGQPTSSSPILQLSMYPPTGNSTVPTTIFSTPGPNQLNPSRFDVTPVTFPNTSTAQINPSPSSNTSNTDLKPALRKLQTENRNLTLQLAALKRQLSDVEQEKEDEFVEKSALIEVQDELESVLSKLQRREQELRQLRQESPAATTSSINGLKDLATGSGIEISPMSPSSTVSIASSSPQPTPQIDELTAEVSKLQRALQTRTTELTSVQSKLRETKSALTTALETMISRQVVTELENQLEQVMKESATRDGYLSAANVQVEHLTAELQHAESSIRELRATSEAQLEELRKSTSEEKEKLHAESEAQLKSLEQNAKAHINKLTTDYEALIASKDQEFNQFKETKEMEIKHLNETHEQVLLLRASESGATKKDLDHAHTLALERLQNDLQAEVNAFENASHEWSQRRSEFEAEIAKVSDRLKKTEEEKQRLDLLVATLSQQMAELVSVTTWESDEFDDENEDSTDFPNLHEVESQRQPSRSPTRRRPSQSPPRSSGGQRTRLFSPESNVRSANRGRARFASAQQQPPSLFQSFITPASPYQQLPANLNTPASTIGIANLSVLLQQPTTSPLTLPMSPERIAAGNRASAEVEPLAVVPHVTSISQSMQRLYERLIHAHERSLDFKERLQEYETKCQQFQTREIESATELTKAREHVDQLRQTQVIDVQAKEVAWNNHERELQARIQALDKDLQAAERALDIRAREVEGLKSSQVVGKQEWSKKEEDWSSLLKEMKGTIQLLTEKNEKDAVKQQERLDAALNNVKALEETRMKLEQRVLVLEASLQAAPTKESVQQLNDRLHQLQLEKQSLESQHANLLQRAQSLETDRASLKLLREEHKLLEESAERLKFSLASEADEKRELQQHLERTRVFEQENALLQQRLQQSERRVQVVGQDQQLNIQVTRRVLQELCEVLHAAKIPSSNYTDASAARTPTFLTGAQFHYPDDAEQAIKWIKGKIHELQRIRRAFDYTVTEVEEKWKSNFHKLQSLLEQRGAEITVLQRRLLTALGQTTTVTGTLKWK